MNITISFSFKNPKTAAQLGRLIRLPIFAAVAQAAALYLPHQANSHLTVGWQHVLTAVAVGIGEAVYRGLPAKVTPPPPTLEDQKL